MNRRLKNNPDDFYSPSKFEIRLIIIVLAMFCLIIPASNMNNKETIPAALIYKEGRLIKTIFLDKNQTINLADCRMDFLVKDKRIRVMNSTCLNKLCVRMGWIGADGQTVVCVPSKVLVRIESDKPASLDAVCY